MTIRRSAVLARLRSANHVDSYAEALCMLVTGAHDKPYEGASAVKVERLDTYNILILAHHRQVIGRYAHVFSTEDNLVVGRYEFLLMPALYEGASTVPIKIFDFSFNYEGEFRLTNDPLNREFLYCNPDDYYKPLMRDAILNHVLGALQESLSE
ncbi:hypothetical protein [Massilia litorea]|uniref:Uncharacterized protein n=1 Tax=Massilia litorea TaxID=2769491 RepID=A0A7L9U1B1_9BURK|nr:hypothetical protein [Massilia litorea]QOL48189.1 hypothetical protein LPB04_14440 [Massilia litorea]